jgi:acetyltransferase
MAKSLIDLAQRFHQPLAIAVIVNLEELDFFRQTLRAPVFTFPEEAIQALASARDWHNRSIPPSPPLPADVPDFTTVEEILTPHRYTSGPLPLPLALQIGRAAGIPVPDWRRVHFADAARVAADDLGYPVCLKLVAPSAVHKSDLGAVVLRLDTPGAVVEGFSQLEKVAANRLPAGEVWEVVVMPQIEGGIEVLAGAKRDATFGPVIMVGAGGIWVEFLQDVAMGIAPLSEAAARRLIDQTRISALLQGRRGQPPADIAGLAQTLVRLSTLMLRFPFLQEVDLNPLRVFPAGQGIMALDARIIVGDTYAKD